MQQQGYVYVLHFDSPLAHARHYIGCTMDPRARLIAHAQGRTAAIMRAVKSECITFRLGALGTTHKAGMRRIERQVKDWHQGEQFCAACRGEGARALPGTTPYPLEVLPFPLTSPELAALTEPRVWTTRQTTPADPLSLSTELARVSKSEKDCIGFIPAGGDGGATLALIHGRVIVAEDQQHQVGGFVLWSENDAYLTIAQTVVQDAYRGQGIGRMLIDHVARVRPGKPMFAKVRDSLHANGFWQAIGFKLDQVETHPTSGSALNVYFRK